MTESRGPTMAPPLNVERGADQAERWRHFDSSVNAVSFGFVATAILISMFLLMALFERFLRPRSPSSSDHVAARRRRGFSSSAADLEAHRLSFSRKLNYPSPKMSIYSNGVSVLMPGNDMPTFLAHPAAAPVSAAAPALVPCPPERILWPSHHHMPIGGSTLSSS